jgi:hypothetical protein
VQLRKFETRKPHLLRCTSPLAVWIRRSGTTITHALPASGLRSHPHPPAASAPTTSSRLRVALPSKRSRQRQTTRCALSSCDFISMHMHFIQTSARQESRHPLKQTREGCWHTRSKTQKQLNHLNINISLSSIFTCIPPCSGSSTWGPRERGKCGIKTLSRRHGAHLVTSFDSHG